MGECPEIEDDIYFSIRLILIHFQSAPKLL